MKPFTVVIICLFVSMFANAQSPTQVAEAFLSALEQKDYAEAKKYCTPDSYGAIDALSMLFSDPELETIKHKRIFLDEKVYDNNVVVNYKIEGEDKTQSIQLEKN